MEAHYKLTFIHTKGSFSCGGREGRGKDTWEIMPPVAMSLFSCNYSVKDSSVVDF